MSMDQILTDEFGIIDMTIKIYKLLIVSILILGELNKYHLKKNLIFLVKPSSRVLFVCL